jgi:selenocysteine lyase/cysteine desulfurase
MTAGGIAPDWAGIRAGFPSIQKLTFLNTATFGQLSAASEEAIARHLARRREFACADFLSWYTDLDGLRAKLAQLIHATSEDIAFMPNASWALAHLLNGLDWREGDEVVTAEGEFSNHLYVAEHLTRRGVKCIRCGYEEVLGLVTPRTRLVMLSTVNYSTGYRARIDEIAAELRRRGVLFYLDATQSLGALQFDFSSVQPDLLAVDCYKWMLAPNGAAFMAVRPELRQRLAPLAVGWRSHFDWRNVDQLWEGVPEFTATAEKYEAGMLASLPLCALEASVDLMLSTGPDAIERRVLELSGLVRERLRALGGDPLPYGDSAIAAVRFPGRDASALAVELKRQGIIVSARHGLLRVSTHFYNNEGDAARLAAILQSLL